MQRNSNRKKPGVKKQGKSYWIKERSSKPFRQNARKVNHKRIYGEKLDISKLINKAAAEPAKEFKIEHSFEDFDFVSVLKENVKKRNYVSPTPVQDQSIIPALEGRDLVGLANTGTGKTAAFLLPLIHKVYKNKTQNVLIMAPTRELAIQIENEFRQFSWGMRIFSAICVGGAPIYKQINNLRRNPNFVIGTPGRLKDLAERGILKFNSFQNVVIDEFDRMLDMGFIDDIKEILNALPAERQSLFFSATMPPKIKEIINQFAIEPIFIEVKTGATTKNVEQDIVRIRGKEMKFFQLKELLSQEEVEKALVFIETKSEVEKVTTSLRREGFKAESIHGDKKQSQRQRALTQFKRNEVNILVATDVAARGLDIKDITHVINYTMPQTYDDYVHRVGRAGRGNNKGFAFTFVG